MLHSNGQNVCSQCKETGTTVDTRNVSEITKSLLPSQIEFIDFIMFHGAAGLSESLKLIHDLALYHSDVPFDEKEKSALFDLKILWEGLEQIEEES